MIAIVVVVITALLGIQIFCIAPNSGREERLLPFCKTYIAHRGLFDHEEAPENSMPAFRRAVDSGFGIELDLQLTRDEKPVVFHDESLKRMCGVDRLVRECTLAELQQYTLEHSGERIPLFRDVLDMVAGQVPIVVEIKSEGGYQRITPLVAELLDGYRGEYCIESFHPLAVAWFRKNRPEVIRGQLATGFFRGLLKTGKPLSQFLTSNLLLNRKSAPDFIAYNRACTYQPSFLLCRWLYPVVTIAWTVRSPGELARARKHFRGIIFDSFVPDKPENQ